MKDELRDALMPVLAWPALFRFFFAVAAFLVVFALFWWFLISDQLTNIETVENNIITQQDMKRAKLVALGKSRVLEKEYKQLESLLTEVQKRLPDESEIPDLLDGVTRAGQSAGLDFSSFVPQAEKVGEFYAAVPISFAVSGSFHQVLLFLHHVAGLERIVNMTQLSLSRSALVGDLTVLGHAETYRFLSQAELAAQKAKAAH